jgi:hypothetical protein
MFHIQDSGRTSYPRLAETPDDPAAQSLGTHPKGRIDEKSSFLLSDIGDTGKRCWCGLRTLHLQGFGMAALPWPPGPRPFKSAQRTPVADPGRYLYRDGAGLGGGLKSDDAQTLQRGGAASGAIGSVSA